MFTNLVNTLSYLIVSEVSYHCFQLRVNFAFDTPLTDP